MDTAIGNLITSEYGIKGLSSDGKQLLEIQHMLRDRIRNAGEGDVTGGAAGFAALDPARKAWSQAQRMADLERIRDTAAMKDNEASSIKTQLTTLVDNAKKSRGYSDEEIAALKQATDRGLVGGALHVFGNRLVPMAIGLMGLHEGAVAGLVGAGVAHGVGAGLRAGAASIARGRLKKAMGVLGEGLPARTRWRHPTVSSFRRRPGTSFRRRLNERRPDTRKARPRRPQNNSRPTNDPWCGLVRAQRSLAILRW